ncbi:ABC transporter permease subunit [Miltoncostaea oceani]|uniref:ABC transporter permease subunit n=1 Tax=Miltoncostaea oceani TaxID=2843216 RepID=UPI001C3C7682|nr:ABC transporter permease subunit [Miltoncostaea oceani]
MRPDVAIATLRGLRRSLTWWAIGLAALVAVQVSVYPTVRDDSGFADLTEQYPEVLKDLFGFGEAGFDYTSAAGYLGAELFSLMVPLLLIIAAVGTGAGGIAGEEERGTLDLLLSLPVSRGRVVAEKLVAMAAEVLLLGLVVWVALAVGVRAVDMDVSVAHLAAAAFSAALLAMTFGALAMLAGAATGRRATAIGAAAALAVAAYLVNSLGGLVSWLEPLRPLTPFHHYEAPDPLRHGLEAGHLAVLIALPLVVAVVAVLAIDRRDLGS